MPLNTDLNVSPYFEDFDELKNYHRVLFRPAAAVQARELTQIQSILQNQIERFGNWAFRNGDIVTGCAVNDIPRLPFVRLADFQSNGAAYDIEDFANTVVVSTTGLEARVIAANSGLAVNYPNTMVLYVSYLNTGDSGEQTFSNNESLTIKTVAVAGNTNIAVVNSYANATASTYTCGNAHGIEVSSGIIFINGHFVRVADATIGIVNATSTNAGNSVVGFQLIETVVTENQDDSLLDNALGYSNENAPGAHRLKLTPTLISLDPATAANTEGFNPIAVYNFGTIVNKTVASQNVYSILGDALEKRTYEESGNYVVNPFMVDTVTSSNSIVTSMDANNVLGRISPGVGYAQGARVEILNTQYINMRRGIDTQSNEEQQITFNYGSYFRLNEVAGTFDFKQANTVQLYDAYQKAVTEREFGSLTPVGNNIGTAQLRALSLNSGSPGSNTATYNLHVFNIQMANGYNASQVKSVYFNGSVKGVGDLAVPGLQGASSKGQLFSFGVSGLKSLRDASNNNNTAYTYRTKATGTMAANGVVSITLAAAAPGGSEILPYGVGILPDSVTSDILLIATANVDSSALTGTVNVSSTSTTVGGNSTQFLTDLRTGDQIKVGSDTRTVAAITNSTSLTVDAAFGSTLNSQTYYKTYRTGKHIPISGLGYVNVTNTTNFAIVSGQAPSASLSVEVVYDVLRTSATPAAKAIKKGRYVKIATASNPKGPWCLGFSDVHKINKVYGTSNGTYTTSGADITDSYVFDPGQKDTHYDLAYLHLKPGYTATPNLLVELDYFAANTTPGVGFYTVESYPIDDANTANTNAIQTKDIPLYIDEAGRKISLRDYVDFRPVATPTATDTTVIGSASVNPSNTLSLSIPSGGLNAPSYGKNFEADYTIYLPRKDLVFMTPTNTVKVKEGLPGVNPQTPLFPENSMALAVITVPPYPSLSTDQTDAQLATNRSARSLVRDTSTAISSSIVTNRRYTMRDIGKLDQRIGNLEYYTQLSLLEKKAADMTITDENGLDRFKNGMFVDPMGDFALSDVANPEYSVAIDRSKGVARPRINREYIDVKYSNTASSNGMQQTGRLITLAYNEVNFMTQPYATKYRSSAHAAFAWNGRIVLMPSYDNHIDTKNTGSLNITIDNSQPWKDFAASPYGSTWGDWRTSTNTVVQSVLTDAGTGAVIGGTTTNSFTQQLTNPTTTNFVRGPMSQVRVVGVTAAQITNMQQAGWERYNAFVVAGSFS